MGSENEKLEPRYEYFTQVDGDISFGMPIELDGVEWMIDRRLYLLLPERPVGVIFTLGDPADRMTLVQGQYHRAIRLRRVHDDIQEPEYRYIPISGDPKGMFGWDQIPIEYISGDQDIEKSLQEALLDPSAKAMVVDIEKIWRDAGAKKDHKVPKPLRITR